jgi:hypothetical protein
VELGDLNEVPVDALNDDEPLKAGRARLPRDVHGGHAAGRELEQEHIVA